jgi:hypothetical protein
MAIYKPKRKINSNGATDDVKFPASCIEGLDEITGLKASAATSAATNVLMEEGNKLVYKPLSEIKTNAGKVKLTGDASGEANFDSTGVATISVAVADDSHNHTISNVDGLQTALNGKANADSVVMLSGGTMTGTLGMAAKKNSLYWTSASASQGYYAYSLYNDSADEGLVFGTGNNKVSFVFRNDGKTSWSDAGAALQIKNNTVAVNKTITGSAASYNLDVNGTANATTLYESGTSLANKYQAKGTYAGTSIATQNANGLMSATDKYRLDTLSSYLMNGHDDYVDSLAEVMAIFEKYPQGASIVDALSDKVDKVSGKGLSTNDFTAAYKTKVDNAVTVGDTQTVSGNKTFTGQQTFTSDKFSLYVAGDNKNDSWFKFTDDGSTYYAFGIRRPYDSYGFQIKKHTTSGDSYYDIYHQGNYTKMPAATTSAAGLMSSADKTKLDGIATGANNYSLPAATSSALGGVKIGSNITNSSGTISLTKANVTSALGYTPPTTNTTYSAATTSAAGLMSAADKTKLDGIATGANAYSHPTTSGNKHIPAGGSSGQILRWSSDGTAVWGNDNNTTYSNATQSAAGLMSAADKTKVDNAVTLSDAQTISGTKTFSSHIKTAENVMGTKYRTHDSYETGVVYGTSGNEALTFAIQNPVTAFQIVYGTKPSAYAGGTWQSVTPLFQTKDGKVIINRKIASSTDSANLKLFDVNGDANATTLYENGTALSNKYQAKGTYAGTAVATTSAAGLMSATDKSKLDGIASGANNFSLPTRLTNYTNASNRDATESGWYYAANMPETLGMGSNQAYLYTAAYSSGWASQIAIGCYTDKMAFRRNESGVWKDWKTVATVDQIPTFSYSSGRLVITRG